MLTGVMEMLLARVLEEEEEEEVGKFMFMLKELITLGPVEAGVGDLPVIFMGGGTNTVLTWTGRLVGGEVRGEAKEEARVEARGETD